MVTPATVPTSTPQRQGGAAMTAWDQVWSARAAWLQAIDAGSPAEEVEARFGAYLRLLGQADGNRRTRRRIDA